MLVEVLLQSKTIYERPIVCTAHAFVFWGFLAFDCCDSLSAATHTGVRAMTRTTPLVLVLTWFVLIGSGACGSDVTPTPDDVIEDASVSDLALRVEGMT